MCLAESSFRSETVDGGTAVAKSLLNGAAKRETDAIEVARDTGLMLAELFADFGKGLFLGVVQAQALVIARIEGGESGLQRADEKCDVAFAMRVGRLDRDRSGQMRSAGVRILVVERLEAAVFADRINVPLGQHGAKPGLERAAAVEITEKRVFPAGAFRKSIEFGEEGVGEFASLRGGGAASKNSRRCGTQIAAILRDEMLPRGFRILETGSGERKIFEMQGAEILVELFLGETAAGEAFLSTALKGGRKTFSRQPPTRGVRLGIEPLGRGGGSCASVNLAKASGSGLGG